MTKREYEAIDVTLTPIELECEEFETAARLEGWSERTVTLMLRPPLMQEPFKMGEWWVTLVEGT